MMRKYTFFLPERVADILEKRAEEFRVTENQAAIQAISDSE